MAQGVHVHLTSVVLNVFGNAPQYLALPGARAFELGQRCVGLRPRKRKQYKRLGVVSNAGRPKARHQELFALGVIDRLLRHVSA